MDLGLESAVIAVAGSSRGIGRAIAQRALEEGASVVIGGRDEERLAAAARELASSYGDARVLPVAGDVGTNGGAAAFVSAALERHGRIDGLVLNAGTGRGRPGWDTQPADWDELFHANLATATRVVEAALPSLVGAGRGSIVFVASIVALEATGAPLAYSAAKAAIVNYANNLARIVGADGVRVNTVAPGNVLFPGGRWEERLQEHRAAIEQHIEAEVPLRRFGTPDEIADVALFLLSERASFVTGACVVADGGQTRS